MGNPLRKYPPLLFAGREEKHPLSYQQERLYYLSLILPDSSVWNLVSSHMLTGNLQVTAMKKAVSELAERHHVLRSVIAWQDDAPCQTFTRNVDELFSYTDLNDMSAEGNGQTLQERLEDLWYQPIRLNGEDLLFQALLIRTVEEEYIMLLKLHHIIADGTSLQILWRDLKCIYNSYLDGVPADLPALKLDYGSYARWQRQIFAEEFTDEQESYWLKEFQGEVPVLDLPTDFAPPAQLSFNGALTHLELPEELVKSLRLHCMKNRVILFSGLMTVFYVLLHKLAGQEDIVVGTVFNGRHYGPEFTHPAGFFVNTVAVRMGIEGGLTYTDLLKSVHNKIDDAYFMQDYPFERLIRVLNPDREHNRIPLFRTMFNMVTGGAEELRFMGLEEVKLESDANATQTDLLFDVRQEGTRTSLWVEYNTELFREETVRQLLGMYVNLLQQIVSSPEIKVEDLELTSPQEREQILKTFNDTTVPFPSDRCIHELFDEQVKRTPDRMALCYGNRQWTYREVNRQAGRLASRLHNEGVGRGSVVGILAERSPELVIGLLGILKAGAAYLPMDPAYPEERNRFMVEDSGVSVLLVQSHLNMPSAWNLKTLLLDEQGAEASPEDSSGGLDIPIRADHDGEFRSDQLAYVMYTSGSTGTPKGVLILHRNVVRLVCDGGFTAFEPEDRLLLTGSPSFDAVTFEIWGSLLNGVPLVLADSEILLRADRLRVFIREQGISLLWLTAALFQQLAEEDPGLFAPLRCLFVGGDLLPVRQVRQVREACPGLQMLNMYGPTENTTFSTFYPIEDVQDAGIPIGKPISNSTAYILDSHVHVQPVGVPGELYVGGDGLARGYLNRPELTAERFLPDPFRPGQRIYKTGDRAKWLPDGNLAFLGRLDNQVKIRGYRVELGEIETSLLACGAITEAAVIAREDREGSKYLCAYVVCGEYAREHADVCADEHAAVSGIREFLNERLPGYMVPAVIIVLPKLPLTQNGKVDRKQLPVPPKEGVREPGVLFRAPAGTVEKQLAEIWREVLDRKQVSADEHFFDCGGHSLKAMVLMSRINRSFQVELPLREIFQAPTLSRLAERIEAIRQEQGQNGAAAIPSASPCTDGYPASASQQRMYVLYQMMPEGIGYNVPLVLQAEGNVDVCGLEEALNTLLKRHESLRTSFHMVNGGLLQRIAEDVSLRIEYREAADEAEAKRQVQAFIRPFELSQAPLMRAALIEIKDGRVLVVLDTHHIVTDGVSTGILLRELSQLYDRAENGGNLHELEALGLPEGKLHYKDYAAWQQDRLRSEALREQEAYWLNRLQGEIPVLNLTPDYPRPPVQSFEGDRITFKAERQLYEGLKKTAAANGATLYMTLLAGYQVLLSKYSGQEDILVGTPIAGRQHADVQNMVGMFVNTLVMRGYPRGNLSFREFLQEVRGEALEAYDHQEVPFEDVVEKVQVVRDMSRNPLFDTMFALQNTEQAPLVLKGVTFSETAFEYPVSKFDLTLTAEEGEEMLRFEWEYAVKLFKPETVKRMAEHYIHILEQVTENPDQSLSDLKLITPREQEQILRTFNDTTVPYPSDRCIHELFDEQVKRTPDRTALCYGNRQWTYREVNRQAGRLASRLHNEGVARGSVVAILAERSPELVIGLLGILKAGAAYLPMDPAYPEERNRFMVEDSGVSVLLVQSHLNMPSAWNLKTLLLDEQGAEASPEDSSGGLDIPIRADHDGELRSDQLAYVMYTSGSTGTPKGVLILHRNVVRLVCDGGFTAFEPEDRLLLTGSPSFDAVTFEIWGSLLNGVPLVLADSEILLRADRLRVFIREQGISLLWLTAALFQQLAEEDPELFAPLRCLFVGGDLLPVRQVRQVREACPELRMLNMYGPTENTTFSTFYPIEDVQDAGIPIGKPISNSTAYILDTHGHVQPVGVPGELYVGGDGLARGYLNRPELTAERFLPDPFRPGQRIYKTGDRAKWLPDGNLAFLGRLDNQVKIRGYRVELGEIETSLLACGAITEAAVIAREDREGSKYLCAYVVCGEYAREHADVCADEHAAVSGIREFLNERLPGYMVPAVIIVLPKLPLTQNGKVDRKQLPVPPKEGVREPGVLFRAPAGTVEKQLAEIWREVLDRKQVSADEHFFDCGGHSLKAMVLMSRINRSFQVELPLREIFQAPTLSRLAERIEAIRQEQGQNGAAAIPSASPRADGYPASASQQRMYVLYQMIPEGIGYNVPLVLQAEGNVDVCGLEEALNTLLKRHESLRTSFHMVNGGLLQRIAEDVSLRIEYREAADEAEAKRQVQAFIRPFELSQSAAYARRTH